MADLLEIGANSVRLSHYQHPQKMYDLCDETGMIVWAEIPFLKISKTEAFFENACQQLKELILQNMHHPSICFWGVQNEIAMFAEDETTYEQVRGLNNLVKELDSTRISASANLFCVKNDSELNFITDAVGYNIYFGWYYGEMNWCNLCCSSSKDYGYGSDMFQYVRCNKRSCEYGNLHRVPGVSGKCI